MIAATPMLRWFLACFSTNIITLVESDLLAAISWPMEIWQDWAKHLFKVVHSVIRSL